MLLDFDHAQDVGGARLVQGHAGRDSDRVALLDHARLFG